MTSVAFIGMCLAWGFSWFAMKLQVNSLVPIEISVFYRFFAVAILMILLCLATKSRLKPFRTEYKYFFIIALTNFSLNFLIGYHATTLIPSGMIAVIFSLSIITSEILKAIFDGKKIEKKIIFSSFFGFVGLLFFIAPTLKFNQDSSNGSIIFGFILAILMMIIFSIGNYLVEKNKQQNHTPLFTSIAFASSISSIYLLIINLFLSHQFVFDFSPNYVYSLIYQIFIASIVAFLCLYYLIQKIGTVKASYTALIYPIIALIISSFFEKFEFTILGICGLFFILIALMLEFFLHFLTTKFLPFTKMSLKPEYKIIADHLRSSCFLIADGVMPSNEGRGYVLRRIMRRAMRQVNKLGGTQPIMFKLVDSLITEMGSQYPELSRARDTIIDTLKNEEEKFQETLDKGLKILSEEISAINLNDNSAKLSGQVAFKLYDTFGFPLDLTQDICREKNLTINLEEFDREMELQKERARKNWSGSGEISEEKIFFDLKEKFGETKYLYHQNTKTSAKILAIYQNFQPINSINSLNKNPTDNIFIILDQTPFYATSGGQKGDDGNFILANEILDENSAIDYNNIKNFVDICETKKFAGSLFVHFVSDFKGNFAVGDKIFAMVNNRHRQLRAQNHSATHLLHKALKEVLGLAISQKGSNVDVSQLTFDFNLNRAMTIDEIEQTEELVNFYIRQNSVVNSQEMDLQSARDSGAMALFGEKYDNLVRVVAMGPSIELCGGTHVENTGNIGVFKIISENGVASGIRRITAKSGFFAVQHYKLQEQKLFALLDSLKIKQQFDEVKIAEQDFLSNKTGFNEISFFSNENSSQIINQSQKNSLKSALEKTAKIGVNILQDFKEKEREITNLKKQIWQNIIKEISPIKLNDLYFLSHVFDKTSSKDLRDIINEISTWEQFSENHILIIFAHEDNKINVAIKISTNLTNRFDASKLIVPIIEKLGGKGGGGKKDFAMGGGVEFNKINEAIEVLKNNLQ